MEIFWRLLGSLCQGMALAMGAAFLSACAWQEWSSAGALFVSALFAGTVAFECLLRSRHAQRRGQMNLQEGTLFIVLAWPVLGILGMLPYLLGGVTTSVCDAFFDSIAALTTVGLSAMELSRLAWPHSLALWHGLMSWLGGLGFVIMLMTVMPQISGCFGVTLSARQTVFFSPVWSRMRDSIGQGTKVYALFTLVALLAFWASGVSPWGSLLLALLIVSSGGDVDTLPLALAEKPVLATGLFFQGQASLPVLSHGPAIALLLAMFLASLNLMLFWQSWKLRSLRLLLHDTEMQVFVLMLLAATFILALHLLGTGVYGGSEVLMAAAFQALSFLSASGLVSSAVWSWPDFDRFLLSLLAFVGGCIGSAAGGLKVIRLIVMSRIMNAGLKSALHPHAVTVVKLDGLPISEKIAGRMMVFFFLYVATFILFSIGLALAVPDILEALRLALACLTGCSAVASLGGLWPSVLPAWGKLVCTVLMVAGRLEIFSLLVLIGLGLHRLRERW